MLQQTQVATVIPYYSRFLKSFPTVDQLAAATLDEVYQHWAGLGYYRRARQMHMAAMQIVNEHAGQFPTDLEGVRSLPGIGRYTAGAILSFSSDQRQPIVEANTQRLYARLLHLQADTGTAESQARLWEFAERILPSKRGSGQTNQALMEIGSQICLPKCPVCDRCPLKNLCPTQEHGTHARVPAPKKKKIYTELREAALVIQDRKNRVLMRRCSEQERWAGLWDFPRFDITNTASAKDIRSTLQAAFEERFGCPVAIGDSMHEIKHAVTRYRITLSSYEAQLDVKRWPARFKDIETQWASPQTVAQLPLCSSGKRLWQWLQE